MNRKNITDDSASRQGVLSPKRVRLFARLESVSYQGYGDCRNVIVADYRTGREYPMSFVPHDVAEAIVNRVNSFEVEEQPKEVEEPEGHVVVGPGRVLLHGVEHLYCCCPLEANAYDPSCPIHNPQKGVK